MSPRVSIVMPSYNHEKFVAQAIQSALDQSFEDVEIVVTDDASRDSTPDIVREFRDGRVRLQVLGRNRGACIALNTSIRRAQGEYVCYLASDDFFLPGKLQRQVDYLDAHPEVLAVFGMPKHVDENGQTLARGLADFSLPFAHANPTRSQWLRHFFFRGNCLAAPTAMIRRSAYDSVGLFDPRLAGLPDFDMWVRICMIGTIHVLQEELTAFRVLNNAGNMSAVRPDSIRRDMFEFFEILKHYRHMPVDLARQVFAEEIAKHGIGTDRPLDPWLAEIALLGTRPAHQLFAMDTMFAAGSDESLDHNRLIKLVGELDPFGLAARAVAAEIGRAPAFLQRKSAPTSRPNIGRNDPCPCGSGKKFKNCHGIAR